MGNLGSLERNDRKGPREYLTWNDFTLQPGIYFVRGAKNGALCDTNTGGVYSLNDVGCQIVLGEVKSQEFWENLQSLGLATTEKVELTSQLERRANKLGFVWFEIVTDDCNERCAHCYADSMPRTHRAQNQVTFIPLESLPVLSNSDRVKMSHADWERQIKESFELGCRSCQFIGGEPFLYRGENGETVLDLIEYAREAGYEAVEVFTNGTLLTAEKVERLKALGASVATSLYSIKEEVHEAVTRTPGSFGKIMKALEMLKDAGVTTRVETVVMRTNQDSVDETVEWVEQMGFNHKHADVLRPNGRGSDTALMPDKRVIVEKSCVTQPSFRADKDFFMRNISGHSCLAGKVTITEFGDVLRASLPDTLPWETYSMSH